MPDNKLPAERAPAGALVALPTPQDGELPIRYIGRLMAMLPDPDEDVVEKLAALILQAESPMEENEIWDSTSSKDAVGKVFIWHSVHPVASDNKAGRWPHFLVCKVTDCSSGEKGVVTTGAAMMVTQLVKAQVLGRLPWQAEIVGSRPNAEHGGRALRLRWVAKVAGPDAE